MSEFFNEIISKSRKDYKRYIVKINDGIEIEVNKQVYEMIKYYDNKITELQQRTDKAIEWVKDWTHGTDDWFEEDSKPSELLNILKEVE